MRLHAAISRVSWIIELLTAWFDQFSIIRETILLSEKFAKLPLCNFVWEYGVVIYLFIFCCCDNTVECLFRMNGCLIENEQAVR